MGNNMPIRYVVVGSGWRSLFYWRLSQAYPDIFQMTAMLCRTEEKAAKMSEEYGVPAVTSAIACEKRGPEFVVVAVNKNSICDVSIEWMKKGYPVLCETPAALEMQDMERLWQMRQSEGAKLQTAEQYQFYPSFAAAIELVKKGYLGEPYAVDLSAAHDYHGVSLIRQFLQNGLENMTVSGSTYAFPVEDTDSRYGPVTTGKISEKGRTKIAFAFESGKAGFYDFCGVQYHSFIRSRHLRVQGPFGELDDETLRYVDKDHVPHKIFITKETTDDKESQGGNGKAAADGGISRIRLGDEVLYENPFYKLGKTNLLPQDETAVGTMLLGMRQYIQDGTEVYPLAEALQDAYVKNLMREAVKTGKEVQSETQIWA